MVLQEKLDIMHRLRAQGTGHGARGTGHRAQGTELRVKINANNAGPQDCETARLQDRRTARLINNNIANKTKNGTNFITYNDARMA
jgi:hypothetical protein